MRACVCVCVWEGGAACLPDVAAGAGRRREGMRVGGEPTLHPPQTATVVLSSWPVIRPSLPSIPAFLP